MHWTFYNALNHLHIYLNLRKKTPITWNFDLRFRETWIRITLAYQKVNYEVPDLSRHEKIYDVMVRITRAGNPMYEFYCICAISLIETSEPGTKHLNIKYGHY